MTTTKTSFRQSQNICLIQPKGSHGIPKKGEGVRSEFLLCSELTSPSLPQVSRLSQPGIYFPWEGSWHKCCAGLPAAFGVSQGEAISVNNDLNFQHQYNVIVKWLNETPQAFAVGRMRMRGGSLGGSQQQGQAQHTSRLGGVVLTCTSDGHRSFLGTPALWEKLVYMS